MLPSNHPLCLYETMHPYLLEAEKSCENDGKGVALGGGYLNKIKWQHNCNELESYMTPPNGTT